MESRLDACRIRRGNAEDSMELVESVVGDRECLKRLDSLRSDVRQATLRVDCEVAQREDDALGHPARKELESGRGGPELRTRHMVRVNRGQHTTRYEPSHTAFKASVVRGIQPFGVVCFGWRARASGPSKPSKTSEGADRRRTGRPREQRAHRGAACGRRRLRRREGGVGRARDALSTPSWMIGMYSRETDETFKQLLKTKKQF